MPDGGTYNHAEIATLRERVDGLRDLFEARIAALEKATTIASSAMEKRLDALNEIRGALKDQNATMATQRELEDAKATIENDLRALRKFRDETKGMATQSQVSQATLLSFAALVMGIISLALKLLGV